VKVGRQTRVVACLFALGGSVSVRRGSDSEALEIREERTQIHHHHHDGCSSFVVESILFSDFLFNS
jgi:hypothetical protein